MVKSVLVDRQQGNREMKHGELRQRRNLMDTVFCVCVYVCVTWCFVAMLLQLNQENKVRLMLIQLVLLQCVEHIHWMG